ncbi:MAG: HgcAB-associated protein [Dehalococcoidales bacterium]|jgi:AbrB family looped-hinge helix DNA binding protein|nr:HgcAB-associated protein [Dehalococcoidales bacterium]MDP7525301.1 HgcAB-associated protein [Dehalococcoidales bacterium]
MVCEVSEMPEDEKDESSCAIESSSCCKVEALISVDERGQMVLPKELREKANIQAGDKLAVTSWEKDGRICCISLTKADELTEMMRAILGPVMKDIL